jgi:NAD(P)-dependent dehydrogenase (short-subunit alcohol dehydrogenase family)
MERSEMEGSMGKGLFDLTGKVCVVTGGNRGIGFGMAKALADAGAQVAIWGSRAERNVEALAALKATPRPVKGQTVDVSNEQQVVDAMVEVRAEFGRIDAVFANAGVSYPAPFLEATTEIWRKTTAVNLDGVFWTLREGARHMVERAKGGEPGGSLVATASIGAITAGGAHEAYCATKGGVVQMIKSVAVELGRYAIRANSILPGFVATEMNGPAVGDAQFEQRIFSRAPLGRWGKSEEFAGIAVYLASDASSFHTGDAIVVDGGYTISVN